MERRNHHLVLTTLCAVSLFLLCAVAHATDDPESLSADIAKALAGKDYLKAIEYCQRVVSTYPQSLQAADASCKMGDCLSRLNRRVEALAAYQWVLANHAQSPIAPEASRGIAYTHIALGQRTEAMKAFGDLAAAYPESPQAALAHLRMGMLYISDLRKDAENAPALRQKALDQFAAALSSKAASAEVVAEAALQTLGMRFEAALDGSESWTAVDSALETFEQSHPNAPSKAKARVCLMRAERATSLKNYEEVIRLTEPLPKTYPGLRIESAWSMLLLGSAYAETGRHREAVATFDAIVGGYTDADNFAGNNVRALAVYFKISCLEKLGETAAAAAATAFLKQTWPDSDIAKILD